MRHKYLVKIQPFPGAKVSCVVDHVQATLHDDKPDHTIQHTAANDIRSKKTSSQTSKSIIELAMPLESDENSIVVSGIVPQFDNLNKKINKVNNGLALMCGKRYSIYFSY